MTNTITDHEYRAEMLTRHLTHEFCSDGQPLDEIRALAYADYLEREGYARESDEVLANYLRHCHTRATSTTWAMWSTWSMRRMILAVL